MKRASTIAAQYAAIAILATAVNIGVQALTVALWSFRGIVELSILAGTAAGLPIKYVLEKRVIFAYRTKDLSHDARLFVLYSLMGVATTLIFWGTEYIFHLAFSSDLLRYAGGILGLAIGHFVKYRLDRRFVFVDGRADAADSCAR